MDFELERKGFEPTAEQIAEWKKKFPLGIHLVTCEGYSAVVKSPGRNELSYASTVAKNDPMKFNESILNKCWIAGDEEIRTNERIFMGVAAKLEAIIEIAEAEIKKL